MNINCVSCRYKDKAADEYPCSECKKHSEPVNPAVVQPRHYTYSKYEPKDVIRAWGLNFNLGCVVKYVARAGHKDDKIQDLEKARQYINFEIEALKEERENDTHK